MLPSLPFGDFRDFLSGRLTQPLPGQQAQFQMAPLSRRQPKMASVEAKACREAGVLALFYPDEQNRPSLLLTRRPGEMKKHAGQVAFPGGRREEGENLEETALRETEEEVFIDRGHVEVLGTLSSLFIPPSNFCVYPFVGVMTQTPDLSLRSDEVADMFGVALSDLVDPSFRRVRDLELAGAVRSIPHFAFRDEFIWGATAMMIAELCAVLDPGLLDLESLI